MLKKLWRFKLVKFVSGGSIIYLVGLILTAGLKELAHLPPILAYAFIQMIITVINFWYAVRVVFKPQHTGLRQIFLYALVLTGSAILNICFSQILYAHLHVPYLLAMIASTGAILLIKYFIYDVVVFKTGKFKLPAVPRYWDYIALGGLATGHVVILLLSLQWHPVVFNADSVAYLFQARDLQQGLSSGWGTGWFGFAYSAFSALVGYFTPTLELGARLTNIIFSTLTYLPLYLIARAFLPTHRDRWWIMLLMLIFTFHPLLLWQGGMILSETSYIFWLLWAIWSNYKLLTTPRWKWAIISSLSWAMTYFTRPEGYLLAGIALVFTAGLLLWQNRRHWRFIACFGGVFALVILPYLVHLHSLTGHWQLSIKGKGNLLIADQRQIAGQDSEMYGDYFERINGELTADQHALKIGTIGGITYHEDDYPQLTTFGYLRSHLPQMCYRLLLNTSKLFTETFPRLLGTWWLGVLSVIGFLWYALRRHQLAWLIGGLVWLNLLLFSLFFILDRYIIIVLPLLYLGAILAGRELVERIPKHKIHPLYYFGAVVLLVWGLTTSNAVGRLQQKVVTAYQKMATAQIMPYEKKEAGEWLKQQASAPRVMERIPITSYYANAPERILLPYTDDLNALLTYARAQRAQYLVVDNREFLTTRPALAWLLDPQQAPVSLRLLRQFRHGDYVTILYQLVD